MTTVKRWSILLWCALPVLAITGGDLAGAATRVQAWSANLDAIANLTPTLGSFVAGNGSAWGTVSFGSGLFGTGVDGSDTISGTESIASEMHYVNLTIPDTAILNNVGYRIFVSGTLTCTGVATIRDNGNSASGITAGAALAQSGVRIQTAAGGTGRNTLGAGSNGGAINTSYTYADHTGTGGSGGSVTGGAGGTGTTSTVSTIDGPEVKPLVRILAGDTSITYLATTRAEKVGLGGGSGGAAPGIGTATSGGGGGGGGVVQVFAARIDGPCLFQALGGNGGIGVAAGGGAAGGGGGGTGGRVSVVAGVLTGSAPTLSAAGGSLGAGAVETSPATNGGAGATQLFVLWQ